MSPSLSVVHTLPSCRRKLAPALSSPPKQYEPLEEPFDKPLETHRYFGQVAAKRCHNPVDEATADEGLADRGLAGPLGAVGQEVMNGHSQVMVWVHQAQRAGNNAVPICIAVVCESNVKLILQLYEAGHRVRAGAVHSDLPVMIESHEAKRRIHGGVDQSDIETIDSLNRLPVLDRGTTERIGAHSNTGGPDTVDVDDVRQVFDVRHEEIVGRVSLVSSEPTRRVPAGRHGCRSIGVRLPDPAPTM